MTIMMITMVEMMMMMMMMTMLVIRMMLTNFSIRGFRAYCLIEIRQTILYGAIRGNSISVNSTPPR